MPADGQLLSSILLSEITMLVVRYCTRMCHVEKAGDHSGS
jgi:hypothetical protein